jgi:hypothetical protein
MESSMTTSASGNDEIARAEAQVRESKAELSRSLREVEKSGQNLVQRVQRELKPALTTALLVAGAAAVIGVTVIVATRRRKSSGGWLAPVTPAQPSALGIVAKSAGLWALRLLARRAAQELVHRLPPAKHAEVAG